VKVLITGAEGQLGAALQQTAPADCTLIALSRRELDITNAAAVDERAERERPDWIFNAAAYTAVDRAESDARQALRVNADGAAALAAAAQRTHCRLLQLSTDFVFDGEQSRPYRPDAATSPLNVYGATKLRGEEAVVRATQGDALIVRTSWVYAARGRNFVLRMLELMRANAELPIVADQVGSPTWATSLATALWELARRASLRGVHHWSDSGVASWYDFAVAIQEEAVTRGLLERAVRLRPIRTEEYSSPARRPAYSVLDTRSTADALGRRPAHWRENLRHMLDELVAREAGERRAVPA
jgi:dTDP-4-dehydrorhamnose reductase